eukprot:1900751-Rhodomonas_salina.1
MDMLDTITLRGIPGHMTPKQDDDPTGLLCVVIHSACTDRAGQGVPQALRPRYPISYARATRCPVLTERRVLSAYAHATRCPVLTERLVLPDDSKFEKFKTQVPSYLCRVPSTEVAYAAMRRAITCSRFSRSRRSTRYPFYLPTLLPSCLPTYLGTCYYRAYGPATECLIPATARPVLTRSALGPYGVERHHGDSDGARHRSGASFAPQGDPRGTTAPLLLVYYALPPYPLHTTHYYPAPCNVQSPLLGHRPTPNIALSPYASAPPTTRYGPTHTRFRVRY